MFLAFVTTTPPPEKEVPYKHVDRIKGVIRPHMIQKAQTIQAANILMNDVDGLYTRWTKMAKKKDVTELTFDDVMKISLGMSN